MFLGDMPDPGDETGREVWKKPLGLSPGSSLNTLSIGSRVAPGEEPPLSGLLKAGSGVGGGVEAELPDRHIGSFLYTGGTLMLGGV